MQRRHFLAGGAAAVALPSLIGNAKPAYGAAPKVRRNVMTISPTDPFFAKYGEAVSKMHSLSAQDGRNWRNQALIHLNRCTHGIDTFPHWHRYYVYYYESICAQLIGDPSFALPYWDWSYGIGVMPNPFYDVNFLNVTYWNDKSDASSPNWDGGRMVRTIGVRQLQKGQGLQNYSNVFSKTNIDRILRNPVFGGAAGFRGQLESQPHNTCHVVTGGSTGHMGSGMSPLDPIFWLHHCNVDRLWAQWQAAGNTTPGYTGNYAGNFVDANGNSVNSGVTSEGALDISRFNYTYEWPQAPELAAAAAPAQASNRRLLAAPSTAAPIVLGKVAGAQQVALDTPTAFTVAAKALTKTMAQNRTFFALDGGPKHVESEPRRILALLNNLTAPDPDAPAALVNVFVNCPDLTSATPTTDPHWAGTFAFFGGAHAEHGPQSIAIDITAPLAYLQSSGAVTGEDVKIQLIPVKVGEGGDKPFTFQVSGVTIEST
jgi:tyrosinase